MFFSWRKGLAKVKVPPAHSKRGSVSLWPQATSTAPRQTASVGVFDPPSKKVQKNWNFEYGVSTILAWIPALALPLAWDLGPVTGPLNLSFLPGRMETAAGTPSCEQCSPEPGEVMG